MRAFHIVRREDALARAVIDEQVARGDTVSVLLLHDATMGAAPAGARTYALKDDYQARGVARTHSLIDYRECVELIFEQDIVQCW